MQMRCLIAQTATQDVCAVTENLIFPSLPLRILVPLIAKVRVWDAMTRSLLRMTRLDSPASCVDYSPDGEMIIVGFGSRQPVSTDPLRCVFFLCLPVCVVISEIGWVVVVVAVVVGIDIINRSNTVLQNRFGSDG